MPVKSPCLSKGTGFGCLFFFGGGGLNVVISSARWLMSCDGLSILLSFFKPSTPVRGLGAGVSPSGFRGSAGGHPA